MKPNVFRAIIAMMFGLAAGSSAQSAPFYLIKDVYPGPNDGTDVYLAADDAKLFFWGYDAADAKGNPWVSDGTASATGLIGSIEGSSANFDAFQEAFANNGLVYFVTDNGFDGYQVWRSDGTSAGTFELTTITGGLQSSRVQFAAVGNHVIFQGGNFSQGYAFMATDGTVAGTQVLSTALYANTCVVAAAPGTPQSGPMLCLGSSGPAIGIISTDGTAAGTTFVAVPALAGFDSASSTIAVNDIVYFAGQDSAHGIELWKTDGTQTGTVMIKDLFAGPNSSSPHELTRVDDRVFFVATTPDAGQELWVSDGTDVGTVRVKDINPGLQDSSPDRLTALNGIVYFVPSDGGTEGKELWRSDGTSAGTTLALGDFNTQPGIGAFDYSYNTVQEINHKLALVLNSTGGSYTAIPYVSDGTLSGTHPMDMTQSVLVSGSGLVPANGKLFASGQINHPSPSYGNELIATDAFASLGKTWCANPEQSVPDNDPNGISSHFHLPTYGGITRLSVSVDIGHTFVGDLQISLRHEQTATEVMLLDQPPDPINSGTCSGALLNIVFDDSAAASAQTSCSDNRPAYPLRQNFKSSSEALHLFNGESLKGDWTLSVDDVGANDRGVLHEWCMNFSTDVIFTDSFD